MARAARDGGIVAEGHVELRIGDLRDVGGRARAVGHREGGGDLGGRIGAVVLEIAAAEIEQAPPGAAGVDERLLARAVLPVERFVAVLLDGLAELVGDGLEGLVPGDALETAFAALADALHRVLEPVGTVEALAHVAALEAGAQLAHLAAVLHGVVGFDADHGAVLRVRAKRAALAAVDHAGGPFIDAEVRHGVRNGSGKRRRSKSCGRKQGRGRQHAAARDGTLEYGFFFHIGLSHLSERPLI